MTIPNTPSTEPRRSNFIRKAWRIMVGVLLMAGTAVAATDETSGTDGSDIIRILQLVNDYQQANPMAEKGGGIRPDKDEKVPEHKGWTRAVWYHGIAAAYRATGDERYREQLLAWGARHHWRGGPAKSPDSTHVCSPNHLFAAQSWLESYFIQKDQEKIAPIIAWIDSGWPGSPAKDQAWYLDHVGQTFIDSLYGAPALAMLAKATGDRRYLEILDQFFWGVHAELFDPQRHLFYRDKRFPGRKNPNGAPVLWSRGNGWGIAGLVRCLEYLPADAPRHGDYVTLLRQMATALAAAQGPDGLWRTNLADPAEYPEPETSGSGFFCYALAAGIRQGYLDPAQFGPVVERAWKGLLTCVSAEGRVGYGQIEADHPFTVHPEDTHEYVTGAFMLAGSEMFLRVRGKTSSLPLNHDADRMLSQVAHPLAGIMARYMKSQMDEVGFVATAAKRNNYLDLVSSQLLALRKHQTEQGAIVDPYNKTPQYASAHYAHCVSILMESGRPEGRELLESGMKALDDATSVLEKGLAENLTRHPDFYTFATMQAYLRLVAYAAPERQARWKARLQQLAPAKTYVAYNSGLNNWSLVHVGGEFLRTLQGWGDRAYVDRIIGLQMHHFTLEGLFHEHGGPFSYEGFGRYYLTAMLNAGYDHQGARDACWKGAWTSLLIQSPTGETPTGFRSAQHIWGDAEMCAIYEIYATAYAKAGRSAEAGAFKRGAQLALSCLGDWFAKDGTGYIVKNRFPHAKRHGYDTYSVHTNYNLLAMSMLSLAWSMADDAIVTRPAPADIGGFAIHLPEFNMIFANADGNYVQYRTNRNDGDATYGVRAMNPMGLLRVHLKGVCPQLGFSDGLLERFQEVGIVGNLRQRDVTGVEVGSLIFVKGRQSGGDGGGGLFRYTDKAAKDDDGVTTVVPASGAGSWRRVTESPGATAVKINEVTEKSVAFTVQFGERSEIIKVTGDGVQIDTLGASRFDYPVLLDDGESKTDVSVDGRRISLTRDENSAKAAAAAIAARMETDMFSAKARVPDRKTSLEAIIVSPESSEWKRSGDIFDHRNGMVERAEAELPGKVGTILIRRASEPAAGR
jgi:rhamnogalacturonyl hydrolase YesR